MTLDAPNWQWATQSEYREGDRGTLALATCAGVTGTTVLFEDFEDEPLELVFTSAGTGDWFRDNTRFHDGTWGFTSPDLDNGEFCDAACTIPGGPNVSFWYFVSSEDGFDFFEVYLDATLVLQESGEVGWTFFEIPVGGATTLTFRFVKDVSSSSGTDSASIDQLRFGEPDQVVTYVPLETDCNGNLKVTGASPPTDTSTLTNVNDSAVSVTLSPANPDRKAWYIFNDATEMLFVKYGAVASLSSFTVIIPCGGFYEMPNPTIYTGVIDGIWAASTGGVARITELT